MAVPALTAQVESYRTRRLEMQLALRASEVRMLPPLIEVDLTDLKKLVKIRQDEVQVLQTSDIGQRLATAEGAFRQFRHRLTLNERLPRIKAYVENRRWAVKAQQSLGNTRAITVKYNELFEELVTERYRALFEEMLKRFRGDIKVTIET